LIKRKPTLTFWEKIYVLELARGLAVTAGHFFRNISLHIVHLFGLGKGKRAAVTYQYPEERRPLAPRWRGRHRLMKREDGSPKCVACMLCYTICPARCIDIVEGEREDSIEKYPVKFTINIGRCIFCGLCVDACPVDAIRMDTGILEMADYDRSRLFYDKEFLMR